ncbi:MAG TPA: chemotaxis-specific protein-glutamate methyltransferase CheB [Spongiibacteraceae bacterium]|jgi:two-component system chemotaxis response regulator CheB
MSAAKRIDVLVVEDSAAMRELLVHILNQDPELNVIGTAVDGEQAVDMVRRKRPDVITMDLHMPRMDGIEAVRIIMENTPTPIVIVSGSSEPTEVAETFRAIEAGALALVEKPIALGNIRAREIADKLCQTVKLMSEVRVVRRWPKRGAMQSPLQETKPTPITLPPVVQLIAMGASTGGPLVLQTILCGLAGKLSVPVLIVQHMATGFTQGFADWLGQSTGIPVSVATAGEHMLAGRVYIAPENFHTEIRAGLCVKLTEHPPENGHRPAVAPLFRSSAKLLGAGAIGVLLSGMGRDGADELKLMRAAGAPTIAQQLETAVVPGMPGEAIKLGAAAQILAPENIAAELIKKIPVCAL